jgi:hypothetical protein
MPNVSSYADTIRDWDSLLIAVRENTELLPDIERHRTALELHMESTRQVKTRQDSFAAGRQGATQDLKEMLTKGRELAIRLRGAVKANIGPKNERLVQFGVAPLRPRRRPPVEKPELPPPAPVPASTK